MINQKNDIPIGINIGSKNSFIGALINGKVQIIRNEFGEANIPSNIFHKLYKKLPYEQIYRDIIKKLKENGEKFLKSKIEKVVIAIPSYLDKNKREKIKDEAIKQGFKQINFISEPIAACLAYELDKELINEKNTEESKVEKYSLVLDLGSNSLDISLINCFLSENNKNISIKDSMKIKNFSSKSLRGTIINDCISDFCNKTKESKDEVTKNSQKVQELIMACENIIKLLDEIDTIDYCIQNFYKNKDLLIQINQIKFEFLNHQLFGGVRKGIEELLKKNKINKNKIKYIFLAGSASRIPLIKVSLKKQFAQGIIINDYLCPDIVNTIGATLKAGKLFLTDKIEINKVDVIPCSLGINALNKNKDFKGDIMSFFIKKGTELPFEVTKVFQTSIDNPTFISTKVYKGNHKYTNGNYFLGELKIDISKKMKKGKVIEVTIKVETNGILSISISDDSFNTLGSTKFNFIEPKSTLILPDEIFNIKNSIINEENITKSSFENYKEKIEDLIKKCDHYNGRNNTLDKKRYYYTKELFEVFKELIKLEKSNINKNILKEIEKYLLFYKDSCNLCENLLDIFSELSNTNEEFFIEILFLYIQIMSQAADKYIKAEGELKFSKFYSKIYLEKIGAIFNKYPEDLFLTIDYKKIDEYSQKKNEWEKKYTSIKELTDFVSEQIEKEVDALIDSGSGYTSIKKSAIQYNDDEYEFNYNAILDIYIKKNDEVTRKKDEKSKKTRAFCLANMIKINFILLKNKDYEKYKKYGEAIKNIEKDPNINITKYAWYQEFLGIDEEINKKIEEKQKLIMEDKNKINNKFNEMVYSIEGVKEFIIFILYNYPCDFYNLNPNLCSDLINELKTNINKSDLIVRLKSIISKYHPDNNEEKDKLEIEAKLNKISEYLKNN